MSDAESKEWITQIRGCARRLVFTDPFEALVVTERLLPQCSGVERLEALINRADLHECFAEYDEATRLYNHVISHCRKASYLPGLARALTGLATVSYDQDRYDDVLRQLDEAAAVSKVIGNDQLLAQTLKVRCYMLTDMGRYNEAIAAANQALDLFEKEGDGFGKVATLLKFADIRVEQKNLFEAKRILATVSADAQNLGYKKAQSTALSYLSNIRIEEGAHSEAEQLLQESIRLNEQIGHHTGIARNYNVLASLFVTAGRHEEARKLYSQAYDISCNARDLYKQTVSLLGLAAVNLHERNYDAAIGHASKAYDIAADARSKLNIVRASRMLYSIEKERRNYPEALVYLEQCTAHEKELLALEQSFELNELQKSYELDKKEKETEIERLKNVALRKAFEELDAAKRAVEQEKERSEQLLLNILPADVAEELKTTGSAAARQYEAVSVLFTDFTNFTSTAEILNPQQLVQELNDCFTAFDGIIERNGLEKIKTIGDAYMAVCGLPVADPRHAHRCIQAALEIRDFIGTRLAARSGHDGATVAGAETVHRFNIRIGIHSGPVVAGIVGVKKFAYDIWGDTVNTAARMEQHSEAGHINISQRTYELVEDRFHCAYRGEITAKNKGKVAMYFVEQARSGQG